MTQTLHVYEVNTVDKDGKIKLHTIHESQTLEQPKQLLKQYEHLVQLGTAIQIIDISNDPIWMGPAAAFKTNETHHFENIW